MDKVFINPHCVKCKKMYAELFNRCKELQKELEELKSERNNSEVSEQGTAAC